MRSLVGFMLIVAYILFWVGAFMSITQRVWPLYPDVGMLLYGALLIYMGNIFARIVDVAEKERLARVLLSSLEKKGDDDGSR